MDLSPVLRHRARAGASSPYSRLPARALPAVEKSTRSGSEPGLPLCSPWPGSGPPKRPLRKTWQSADDGNADAFRRRAQVGVLRRERDALAEGKFEVGRIVRREAMGTRQLYDWP